MTSKKTSALYRVIKRLVRLFYPKFTAEGVQNLPQEPVIVVGNHSQLHGPIVCELYFPTERYTWCAYQMMHLKEVPAYAFQDFWSQKPKYTHWFYKIASCLIAPLSACIFTNANTIPVYHDARAVSTFKKTVNVLSQGSSVVIFPEHDVKYNNIVCDFQDKFIDVARLYYKRTGREISFVPMYIAPNLKKLYLGKPTQFHADQPMDLERRRICDYLMNEITDMARSLPEHTVVPYRNIPKKNYPSNKEVPHENP